MTITLENNEARTYMRAGATIDRLKNTISEMERKLAVSQQEIIKLNKTIADHSVNTREVAGVPTPAKKYYTPFDETTEVPAAVTELADAIEQDKPKQVEVIKDVPSTFDSTDAEWRDFVDNKAVEIDTKKEKSWEPYEIAAIHNAVGRTNAKYYSISAIANRLNRSVSGLTSKIIREGFKTKRGFIKAKS